MTFFSFFIFPTFFGEAAEVKPPPPAAALPPSPQPAEEEEGAKVHTLGGPLESAPSKAK